MATSPFTTQPLPSLDQGQNSRGLAGSLNTPALPSLSTLTTNGNGSAMPSLSAAPTAPKAAAPSSAYTIVAGDTLSAIAAKNGTTLAALLANNPQYQANPNMIKPGQIVNFGSSAPATPSTVSLQPHITTPSGAVVNPSTGGLVAPPPGGAAPAAPKPFTPDPAVIAKMADTINAGAAGAPPAPIKAATVDAPSTPATPDLTALQTADDAAVKAYEDSQNMSPDEVANTNAENALTDSFNTANTATGHQPIPMEFITGQQKNLAEQKNNQMTSLQNTAALLQAKRTAATTASKFALDRADAAITSAKTDAKDKADAATKANTPVSVAPGGTLVNPATGKTVFGAPAAIKTQVTTVNGEQQLINSDTGVKIADLGVSNAQTQVVNAGGRSLLINSSTGATIKDLGASSTSSASDSTPVSITDANGKNVSVPINVAPYYNTSASGVAYADLSTVQGTAAEKAAVVAAAQAAGIKVITNKNSALDLVNIGDALAKLNTVQTVMAGIAQPNWLARDLGGLGLTKLAALAQTDPQKAAAGALQGIGLDILKAISGVQGFRGNSSVVQQITDHLPSINDTQATIAAKISFISQLINDRQDAIVGKPGAASGGSGGTTYSAPDGTVYEQHSDGLYYPKANGSGGTPTATRTDRNNNPTAMTTDAAASMGLKLGVDYTQGDSFKSGNSTLYTAKIIGDPVATTIKAIDNGSFYTASGKPRWDYIAMSQSDWNKMSTAQKTATVKKMYQQEGGTALAYAFGGNANA